VPGHVALPPNMREVAGWGDAGALAWATPYPRPASLPASPAIGARLRRPVPSLAPSRRLLVVVALSLLQAGEARAQADSAAVPTPRASTLGLSAIGAFTVHAGAARVQRGYSAGSLGATLDLGYLRTRRVRVVGDVTYLLTAPRTEVVPSEGATYRDVFRDLSAHAAFAFHANDPSRRLTPYLLAGAGVEVLSSSFNSLAIDTRYNSNNFSLLGALGARLRVGAGSRRALTLELRGVAAHHVRRAAVHVGLSTLFNDLSLQR
jgi:hypothetical protein